jgi:hypothetical protein
MAGLERAGDEVDGLRKLRREAGAPPLRQQRDQHQRRRSPDERGCRRGGERRQPCETERQQEPQGEAGLAKDHLGGREGRTRRREPARQAGQTAVDPGDGCFVSGFLRLRGGLRRPGPGQASRDAPSRSAEAAHGEPEAAASHRQRERQGYPGEVEDRAVHAAAPSGQGAPCARKAS